MRDRNDIISIKPSVLRKFFEGEIVIYMFFFYSLIWMHLGFSKLKGTPRVLLEAV